MERDKTGNNFLGICARDRHRSGQCGDGGKTPRQPIKTTIYKSSFENRFLFQILTLF
jgi:hypothetical protein